MILIGDEHLGSEIWPETPNQAESTEDMMRTVWAEKAYCQQKASGTKTYSLSPSGKEAIYMSLLTSCYVTISLLNWHRF